jgi:arylsulfatase A-like enzyme
LYDQTVFVVTSDHGMVPNTRLVSKAAIYAGARRSGVSLLETDVLSTAGYVYLRDARQASQVAGRLAVQQFPGVEGALYRVPRGQDYVFEAEPLTARSLGPALTQAYLDLCNTLAASSGPEIVLPYAEDTMGLVVPHVTHWGNHGGLSWRTQHIPLIISGPGVRHITSSFPAQLVDVAPTVERLLGLPVPAGVDGVVLGDALARQQESDQLSQRSTLARRSQDILALMTHSKSQHGLALGMPGTS